jgi:hypothetical protein
MMYLIWHSRENQCPQNLPNIACTGRWGFCGTLRVEHFLALSFFCSQAESAPAHQRVPHEEHTGQAASRLAFEFVVMGKKDPRLVNENESQKPLSS